MSFSLLNHATLKKLEDYPEGSSDVKDEPKENKDQKNIAGHDALEVAKIKQRLLAIINKYDVETNPELKPNESKVGHYLKRALPCYNTHNFFCGAEGRARSKMFRTLIENDQSTSPYELLHNVCDSAFTQHKNAWNSQLSREILNSIVTSTNKLIPDEKVKLHRRVTHYASAHAGGAVVEMDSHFFARVLSFLKEVVDLLQGQKLAKKA